MTDTEFRGFNKISRLNRPVLVTEKIDGTNACIVMTEDGDFVTQSRNRIITPDDDNFGFAAWAYRYRDDLYDQLGPGRHYGEWWGQGIQRNYGLTEKRFSLFFPPKGFYSDNGLVHVVPQLGTMSSLNDGFLLSDILSYLIRKGSIAAPGFMNPEGVVLNHLQSRHLYKVTLEDDTLPKGFV